MMVPTVRCEWMSTMC